MPTISINKLEIILNRLIENLRNKGVSNIDVSDDLYWNVPVDKMTVFPEQPELSVGSLFDDISFLESLVEEDYSTNFLELERLASLFRCMAKDNV